MLITAIILLALVAYAAIAGALHALAVRVADWRDEYITPRASAEIGLIVTVWPVAIPVLLLLAIGVLVAHALSPKEG